MKLFRRLVNVGDFKSFVAHPASTTRRPLDEAAFARVGVRPDMVRLSVGLEHIDNLLEHIDNLLEDIDQALGVTLSRGRLPRWSPANGPRGRAVRRRGRLQVGAARHIAALSWPIKALAWSAPGASDHGTST